MSRVRWIMTAALACAVSSGACGDEFVSGTGGNGAGQTDQACVSVSDCDAPTDLCIQLSCQNNRCTYVQAKDQTPVAESEQVPGDCRIRVCLQGAVVTRNSDDPPPDEQCLDHYCEDGEIEQSALGPEVTCGAGANQFCNGMGQCVGCTIPADCGTHPGPCSVFDCSDQGVCEVEPLISQPSPQQTPGNCQTLFCDRNGMPDSQVDATDAPMDVDTMDCMIPICLGSMVESEAVPNGTMCGEIADNRECCAGTCCALGQTCDVSTGTCL